MLTTLAIAEEANFIPVFEGLPPTLEIGRSGFERSFPLSDFFGFERVDDEVVRFVAEYDDGVSMQTRNLDMMLFSERTPVTRANFLYYVAEDEYVDSFIHRTVRNFVIQGGGYRLGEGANGLQAFNVETAAPIVNEFGVSNTLGTVSMAKLGGDPDSATSQWFVSTAENSGNLDFQNGGFTVFGRVTKDSFPNALLFNGTNPDALNEFVPENFGGAFSAVPIHKTWVNPVSITKFVMFRSVGLVPLPAGQATTGGAMTFSVKENPGAAVFSATVDSGALILSALDPLGNGGVVRVEGVDEVGNPVVGSLEVILRDDDFGFWRSVNYTGEDLLDDEVSGPNADFAGRGVSNLQVFAQGLEKVKGAPLVVSEIFENSVRLQFFEKANTIGTVVEVEVSSSLEADDWEVVTGTEIDRSGSGVPGVKKVTLDVPREGERRFLRLRFRLMD